MEVRIGRHFILALFAPLNSTASESFRGRCVDVVQFRFQESLGDDQRADGRKNVAVARRNHLVDSCIQRTGSWSGFGSADMLKFRVDQRGVCSDFFS
jgi:hypothetical protein